MVGRGGVGGAGRGGEWWGGLLCYAHVSGFPQAKCKMFIVGEKRWLKKVPKSRCDVYSGMYKL